jgi:exodeoxyribonuclease VII large subunit
MSSDHSGAVFDLDKSGRVSTLSNLPAGAPRMSSQPTPGNPSGGAGTAGDGAAATLASPPAVIPVSLLVSSARLLLERHLGLMWVSGEISGFTRAASGHCYFNLKDSAAQVRCVFFRHKAQFAGFALKDGLAVEVRATASIYEARGEFQLNVETVRQAGIGALWERFERQKARLAAAGWFAPERKRALPTLPRAVGIVTSPRAAALRDILTTLKRRWPAMPVILYPAAVQGEGAAARIAIAIDAANARNEVDVLIVARGGGSIEDLWAFNEEAVARAVFESRIPVVSGVGHETDFTICDFVADARAATPTGAATLVVPDRHAALAGVAGLAARWRPAWLRALEARIQRLDGLARRLVHPATRLLLQKRDTAGLAGRLARAHRNRLAAAAAELGGQRQRLAGLLRQPLPQADRLGPLARALSRAAAVALERRGSRMAALGQSLGHLNPRAVLERGYAIVTTADGAIVDDAARLAVGDDVTLTLARGDAGAKITRCD